MKPLNLVRFAVICLWFTAVCLLLVAMIVWNRALALPTLPDTTLSIDAYSDPDAVGFFFYSQDGASCDPAKWTDARKVDLGMPTRSADGVRDIWDVSGVPDLKATDCVQVTAYDAAGNESEFASVATPGDNVGWFGINSGKGLKAQ